MKSRFLQWLLVFMALATKAGAEEAGWDFNPYAFQYDMTVYIGLQTIDGQGVADATGYQIGAFCNGECRGIAEAKSSGGHDYLYLRVRSNVAEGETISFKVKDNATGRVADATETLSFASQQTTGYPSEPFLINARNTYRVTFVVDGTEQTSTQYYGTPIVLPEDPIKTGYTFSYWSPSPDATVPAHDVTYTAVFEINYHLLTYYVDNEYYISYELAYGTELTPEADPVKAGYDFTGWTGLPETMPDHDVDVHGSFQLSTSLSSLQSAAAPVRVYDLWGRALAKPQKGVNIVNGRKVVIR